MGTDESGRPVNKLLIEFGGGTPIAICAEAFLGIADEMVIAVSEATEAAAKEVCANCPVPVRIVRGGERRRDSVANALMATDADIVAIHDCARCLVSRDVITASVASAAEFGSGVAAIPVRDTLRDKATGETADRSKLYSMQTPQSFDRAMLLAAYDMTDEDVTDDAALWQKAYGGVRYSKGDIMNQKLTEYGDIALFKRCLASPAPRVGYGEDTHVLTEGRKLILGGVEVPFELGLLGHSDADALIHAVIDALLGAAALGDIGRLFPDSDMQYKDISSLVLLKRTAELLKEKGFATVNVDATIVAQKPKLAPFIEEMRKKTADALCVGVESVSIKATTPEGMGPEGELKCITARAVASVIGG